MKLLGKNFETDLRGSSIFVSWLTTGLASDQNLFRCGELNFIHSLASIFNMMTNYFPHGFVNIVVHNGSRFRGALIWCLT